MIDPESLNPDEVLIHLKQLGYQNISTPQLSEFMHDLKKLIRYEQKYNKTVCSTSDEDISYSYDTGINNDQSSSTNSSDLCRDCNASESDSGSIVSEVSNPTDFNDGKKKLERQIRPHSSFIRPWQLQPQGPPINKSLKNDPVQLYHKYKEMWALQKVPGEKSHSQLRWVIREKMLGQDPHPRPVSQASTDRRSYNANRKQ